MVSSVVKALFVQAALALRARADGMSAVLARAEGVLKDLLVKERGELCGSNEIHKLLSTQTSNRIVLWNKIEAIAETELAELGGLLEETHAKLEGARMALEAKKAEEMPELPAQDIAPLIKQALKSGGFDADDEDQAVESARTSKCGMKSPRRCKRMNPKCIITKGAFTESMNQFSKLLAAILAPKNVRVQGSAIYEACQLLKLLPEEGSPEAGGMTYCGELCEKIAIEGGRASDSAVGQTAGESSEGLQAQVDSLAGLYKKYALRSSKCREASEALKGFRLTLAPLESAIDSTFDAWRKANTRLDEADGALDELMADMEDQERSSKRLKVQLTGAHGKAVGAQKSLIKLRASEFIIKTTWKTAKKKLDEAKESMEDSEAALRAAEVIKAKIGGTVENLVNLYDFFVHEPLRNLNLDGPEWRSFFDPSKEEEASAAAFRDSMAALGEHCREEALPAFSKVQAVSLAPLCQFGGPEAAQGVVETVARRKAEVIKELADAASWMRNFEVPDGLDGDGNTFLELAGAAGGTRDFEAPARHPDLCALSNPGWDSKKGFANDTKFVGDGKLCRESAPDFTPDLQIPGFKVGDICGKMHLFCTLPDGNGGKEHVRNSCCTCAPTFCRAGKFTPEKQVPNWAEGRLCGDQLSWACRADDDSAGKAYLQKMCCEVPDVPKGGEWTSYGSNTVCRGDDPNDNKGSYYVVKNNVPSLDACKGLCKSSPSSSPCQGIEYSPNSKRCELWQRSIGATNSASGYECWYYKDVSDKPKGGEWKSAGSNTVCRGDNPNDNKNTYYVVKSMPSLDACKELCKNSPPSSPCQGVEYSPNSKRCELWQRSIGATNSASGYECWYHKAPPGSDKAANDVSEPVLLREVIAAYPEVKFASAYMTYWRSGGPFLKAIEELRLTIEGLTKLSAEMDTRVSDFADKIQHNIELRKAARLEVQKAIDEKALAQGKQEAAEELLRAQEAKEQQQQANIDALRAAAEAARKTYEGALKTFDEVFIAGTSLELLQTREDVSRGLRPVRRVAA